MGDGNAAVSQKNDHELSETCDGVDMHVLVTSDGLKLDPLVGRVTDDGAGAIATFSGVTRDTFNGKGVLRLEYEAYEPMAVRKMAVSRQTPSSVSASWNVLKDCALNKKLAGIGIAMGARARQGESPFSGLPCRRSAGRQQASGASER